MDVIGALVLLLVLYVALPVAVCAATIMVLGGGQRLLPGVMQQEAGHGDSHDSHNGHH